MSKKKPTVKTMIFMQGYMCCLASIVSTHGENTEHREAFYACASSIEDCELHEVDENDLEILRKMTFLTP